MSIPNSNGRILLVDDDPISLAQVEVLASVEGFEIQAVMDPREALRLITASPDSFDTVLTDFMMPEINGIELMEKIRQLDPTLSTVIITSDTQRGTISASIKGGAVDFLEKPVNRLHIRDSLKRSVAHTISQRNLRDSTARLNSVIDLQQRLSPAFSQESPQGIRCSLDRCFLPLHETGGDFISIFHDGRSKAAIAIGDISGHGVLEGFVASYFQGLVKGMQTLGAPAAKIAEECNQLLMSNWNSRNMAEVSTSLSAAFVTIDLDSMTLHASNFGCPAPILFWEGAAPQPLASSGSPLGWFDVPSGTCETVSVPQSASCFLWSDGLSDAADQLGVSPFALAARVLIERSHPDPALAHDDILVARLDWHPSDLPRPRTFPILHESLPGDSAGDVDALEARMKASILLAIAGIAADLVDQIALCVREAVLNALNHGCLGNHELNASLLIEFLPGPCPATSLLRTTVASSLLRATVSDPGPGFSSAPDHVPNFEVDDHISLGLQVIRALATDTRFSRAGATIEMDFLFPAQPDNS